MIESLLIISLNYLCIPLGSGATFDNFVRCFATYLLYVSVGASLSCFFYIHYSAIFYFSIKHMFCLVCNLNRLKSCLPYHQPTYSYQWHNYCQITFIKPTSGLFSAFWIACCFFYLKILCIQ